jgi:hydrogenase maturation protease
MNATAVPRDAPAADSPVRGRPPPLLPGDRVLLIGVGNELRGDDGVGPHVARAVQAAVPWRILIVHGLTPELADDLAGCDVALVVDAHADPSLDRPAWTIHPPPGDEVPRSAFGHALDVPSLLALTQLLHGRVPVAATLALPARSFGLGEAFTPVAAGAAVAAVDLLLALDTL